MSAVAAIGAEQLREVRLYGVLGKQFGRVHRLAVANVREAVQALSVVVPGFGQHLIDHSEPGYRVFLGRPGQAPRTEEQLEAPVGRREAICIVPVVAGAKSGLGQIILGAVLIGLTAWNPLGLFVGQFAAFSFSAAIGKAMILGGIVQLLSPQRKAGPDVKAESTPSYAFDGAINTSQQGLPVPYTAGRVITGGAVVSAGIDTVDLIGGEFVGPVLPLDPQPLPEWLPEDPYANEGGL